MATRRAKSYLMKGDAVYCNCCDRSFSKFLSKRGRPNAECPSCGSLERTRMMLHYLENETTIFNQHQKVLHFGPEETLFNKLVDLDLEYIDADIHPAYARHVVDIMNIPYPDDYFDLIICVHVISYIPDEEKAMRELSRVMKKSGRAIILTLINEEQAETWDDTKINTPALREKYYGEEDCLRVHGRNFDLLLQRQGLQPKIIDYLDQLDPTIVSKQRLGEGDRERIYLCKKA